MKTVSVPPARSHSIMVDFTGCEEEYRKACDKYGIAELDPAVVKRRWRIFLVVEVVLVACLVALFQFGKGSEFTSILTAVLGPLAIFSLPVAVLYLLGKPPVMTLEVDDSPGARAMARDLRGRTPLSDDEFFSRFFDGCGISKDTITRIRHVLRKDIDSVADRLVPTDFLPLIWEWLDFGDMFYALGREFGVTLMRGSFNGTLDSLIRLVQSEIEFAQGAATAVRK